MKKPKAKKGIFRVTIRWIEVGYDKTRELYYAKREIATAKTLRELNAKLKKSQPNLISFGD
jgi:hypothetical protein